MPLECICSEVSEDDPRYPGVRMLCESPDPKVLVALMECYQLTAGGVVPENTWACEHEADLWFALRTGAETIRGLLKRLMARKEGGNSG